MKLSAIAEALDARLVGDADPELERPVHPADAAFPSDLAVAMEKDLLLLLAGCPARAALVAEGMEVPEGSVDAYLVVRRPKLALAGLTTLFERPCHRAAGIAETARIHPDAEIGLDCSIGDFVVIGPGAVVGDGCVILAQVTIGAGARLGASCLLHPGVRVGDRVELGDRVIVHQNAVIGADGFSFVTPERGSVESAKETGRIDATNLAIRRVNSIGTVIVGDDAEIGANTAIDRGTLSATRIGRHTKIDNLVQIGHNVVIGENCMICGHVGIAGSCVIGDRVVLAGGVGVGDHIRIGDDAVVAAGSGVGTNIPPRSVYAGYPAVPRDRAFEQVLNISRLKSLFSEVAKLKERLKAVEPPVQKG